MEFFIPIKRFYLYAPGPGSSQIWFDPGIIYPYRVLVTIWSDPVVILENDGWIKRFTVDSFKDINDIIKLVILQDKECTIQE